MSRSRRVPCLAAFLVLLAGLAGAAGPFEFAFAQTAQKEAKSRGGPNAPLPMGAIARLGTPTHPDVMPGWEPPQLAFLPDGRAVFATGPRLEILFWDARTG